MDSINSLIALLQYVARYSADVELETKNPPPGFDRKVHLARIAKLLDQATDDLVAVRAKITGGDINDGETHVN
jgi:hypothetical protein